MWIFSTSLYRNEYENGSILSVSPDPQSGYLPGSWCRFWPINRPQPCGSYSRPNLSRQVAVYGLGCDLNSAARPLPPRRLYLIRARCSGPFFLSGVLGHCTERRCASMWVSTASDMLMQGFGENSIAAQGRSGLSTWADAHGTVHNSC